MPIRLNEDPSGPILVVQVSGRLMKEDYAEFVPAFEEQVRQHGKLHILFDMSDFHGWEAGAAWEELKFGFDHFSDIKRLAMVGETRWQEVMAFFAQLFTSAEVHYFELTQLPAARQWLNEADSAT